MKWLQGKPADDSQRRARQQQRNQHRITQHILHPRPRKAHHRIRLEKSSSSTYDEPQTRPFDRPAAPFPMVKTRGRPWIFHRSPPSRSLHRALFSAHTASPSLFGSSLKSSQRDLRSHVLLTSSTATERVRLRVYVVFAPPRAIGNSSPSATSSRQKVSSLQAQFAYDQKEQAKLSMVKNFHVWGRSMR